MTTRATGAQISPSPNVLTIGEAAKLLGVSEMTLRRWHKSGRFVPHTHPISGYRLYKRATVMKLRKQIETGKAV